MISLADYLRAMLEGVQAEIENVADAKARVDGVWKGSTPRQRPTEINYWHQHMLHLRNVEERLRREIGREELASKMR